MGIPLAQAVFIALFLESVLYGVGMTLGIATILLLLRLRAGGGLTNRYLTPVLIAMLVIATPHILTSFIRIFDAFVLAPSTTTEEAELYFANLHEPMFKLKNVCLLLQTILGDSVNVWRCYLIYGSRLKPVIVPLIILVAGIVSGCSVQAAIARTANGGSIFSQANQWIKAYNCLMIATNLYCTVAITWRIYKSSRHRGFTSTNNVTPVLVVIAETGAIYTSALIAFLVVYLSGSNGQYVAIDILVPLVPCMFCLMILQIHYWRSGQATYSVSGSSSRGENPWASVSGIRRAFRKPTQTQATSIAMHPVQIQISTEAEEHFHREDSMHGELERKKDVSMGFDEV